MNKTMLAVISLLLLAGCGEPKTIKMDRMHAVNPMGSFYVDGEVGSVGGGVTSLKMGDVEYTNLTFKDETGSYTFYFLPSAHQRQPAAGDKARMTVRFIVLDQSFAGGGRAPIIEAFEFK